MVDGQAAILILPNTTLPPSEPEVVLEARPAVRAAQQDPGERGHDAPPDGGQARPGRWSGLGRGLGPFSPRAAGAAGRRRRAGTAGRGGAARATSAPRSGPAPARPWAAGAPARTPSGP